MEGGTSLMLRGAVGGAVPCSHCRDWTCSILSTSQWSPFTALPHQCPWVCCGVREGHTLTGPTQHSSVTPQLGLGAARHLPQKKERSQQPGLGPQPQPETSEHFPGSRRVSQQWKQRRRDHSCHTVLPNQDQGVPPQLVLKGHSLEFGLQLVWGESGVRFLHMFSGFQMLIPVFSSFLVSSWDSQALKRVPVTEGGGVEGGVSNWGPAGRFFPTATQEGQLCREKKTVTSLYA